MEILLLLSVPLEVYLLGVVPAEVFSSWPAAALEAQAVLARTYAMYHVVHPRGTEFHLYGDARSQAYDPEKFTIETDAAVKRTSGVYITKPNGEIAFIEYVSKCGRADCPYCQGNPGHKTDFNPEGVWPGRVCQYGMKVMALQRYNYEEIIRHFVGYEIQFSVLEDSKNGNK